MTPDADEGSIFNRILSFSFNRRDFYRRVEAAKEIRIEYRPLVALDFCVSETNLRID